MFNWCVVRRSSIHGGRSFFDEVEFRIITNPVVRIMAHIRGDIDMIVHHGGVPPVHLDLLRNRPEIVIESSDVAITHYLLFNNARRPFASRASREAFNRLIYRKKIVEKILQGAGVPANDFLVEKAYRWNRKRFAVGAVRDSEARRQLVQCIARL